MTSNPIKKLAGETIIYGLGTIIPRILNYLLVPFYTRIFSQNDYGQITELYAWVALIMVFLTYGMETAFFRYAQLEKKPNKVFNTATGSLLITSVAFVLLVALFLGDIAQSIQYSGHPEYIILLALIVAFDAFTSLPFAYLRYQNKARRFSMIKVITVVINIALNFVFLLLIPAMFKEKASEWMLYRPENKIIFVFIANLISSASALLLLIPELRVFRFSIDKALLKKLLAYGLPILVIGVAGMINEVSDKILLKYLLPVDTVKEAEAQIGIYGANYKLAILMMLFIQMFRYAAEPFFFRESGKKEAKAIYSDVMTYFVIFTWLIFLGVTLNLNVVKYFIGPAFREGLMIVPVVLMAKLFLGVFYNLSLWYKLTNKTLYGAVIALAGAAITIALNVILIPRYGYVGSAWANFACYFSMMMISFFWGRKVYKVNYKYGKLILYSALALLLFFMYKYLDLQQTTMQVITAGIFILVYLSVAFVVERKKLNRRLTR
ncbi:MAG: polysaccharide biosynthesis protein [Chlorobi bacterium]|nr:polysaccharide biosynthesis protein [Chlorobiota bacterium]